MQPSSGDTNGYRFVVLFAKRDGTFSGCAVQFVLLTDGDDEGRPGDRSPHPNVAGTNTLPSHAPKWANPVQLTDDMKSNEILSMQSLLFPSASDSTMALVNTSRLWHRN